MSIVTNTLAIALLASGALTFPHSPEEKLSASHKPFTYPAVSTVADAYSAYEIGRQLGRVGATPTTTRHATAADNRVDERAVARQDLRQADCVRRSDAALTERLHASGFRVETHLLAQIADGALRADVCSVYSAHLRSAAVAQCSAVVETSSPTLQLLATVCERRHALLIERNAECLADVGGKLETQCVVACRRQATAAAAADAVRVKVADETREAEVLCRIGVCAVRCLNAQLAECEVPGSDTDRTVDASSSSSTTTEGNATSVVLTPLQQFYERLSATQMLLGLALDTADGRALLGEKVPTKCKALMRKALDDADVDGYSAQQVDAARPPAKLEDNEEEEEEKEGNDNVAAEVDNNEDASPAVSGGVDETLE